MSSGVALHGKSSNGNSIPPVGVLVNVGPPAYPVRLLDHIYMGSQRNADDIELLKRCGITHVLNCAGLRRYDFNRSPYPKEAGIKGFLMISAEVINLHLGTYGAGADPEVDYRGGDTVIAGHYTSLIRPVARIFLNRSKTPVVAEGVQQ